MLALLFSCFASLVLFDRRSARNSKKKSRCVRDRPSPLPIGLELQTSVGIARARGGAHVMEWSLWASFLVNNPREYLASLVQLYRL